MSNKRLMHPAEVSSTTKLDHVRMLKNQYIWVSVATDAMKDEWLSLEIIFLDGNLIIHCPPEFAEHIKIVPYTKDGHAPGMENVRFIR